MAEFDPLMAHVATIVTAYMQHHQVSDPSAIIRDVHTTLRSLNGGGQASNGSGVAAEPKDPPTPAVNPHKSVFSDYIICLEDGKKFKMLKRHLMSEYGLTPDEYRRKWDLPAIYPMVAPNYSKERSVLAKDIGLGTIDKNPVARKARRSA